MTGLHSGANQRSAFEVGASLVLHKSCNVGTGRGLIRR
jgi:hypothetical protein